MADERQTKNERRDLAREQARQLREAQAKKDRRNRVLAQGGIILGVLAIVAIIAVVIYTSVKPVGPGPLNMASDGVLFEPGGQVHTTGALEADATPTPNPTPTNPNVLLVQTWIDFQCPYCQQFETTNSAYLQQLLSSNAIALEVHPIAILDSSSGGNKYSTRSANAAACIAQYQPEDFFKFSDLLYANQPPESGSGMTDDQLLSYVTKAGATSPDVAACVKDQRFAPWVKAATDRALADPALRDSQGRFGTPTVLVNGQRYQGVLTDQSAFQAFIQQVSGQAYIGDGTNPTPTPTP